MSLAIDPTKPYLNLTVPLSAFPEWAFDPALEARRNPRKRFRKFSPGRRNRVVELHQSGMQADQIAKIMGYYGRGSIYRILKRWRDGEMDKER